MEVKKLIRNSLYVFKDKKGYCYPRRFFFEQVGTYSLNSLYESNYYSPSHAYLGFKTNGDSFSIQCNVKSITQKAFSSFVEPTTHYNKSKKS